MSGATPGQSFADLIGNARRAKNLSQEDLESASGVSRSTLSRWERGLADRPEAEHVRAVCRALGIDPRRAAVALGYLTQEEVSGNGNGLPGDLEEILAILQDPAVSDEAKEQWKGYLRYLQSQARRQAG
jgi:transcriptional regulator with XRE-family HTH domain